MVSDVSMLTRRNHPRRSGQLQVESATEKETGMSAVASAAHIASETSSRRALPHRLRRPSQLARREGRAALPATLLGRLRGGKRVPRRCPTLPIRKGPAQGSEWTPDPGRAPGWIGRRALPPPVARRVARRRRHPDRSFYNVAFLANAGFATALSAALNDWMIDVWLSSDARFRGSLTVATQDPIAAAKEIDRLGSRSDIVQILLPAGNRHAVRAGVLRPDLGGL